MVYDGFGTIVLSRISCTTEILLRVYDGDTEKTNISAVLLNVNHDKKKIARQTAYAEYFDINKGNCVHGVMVMRDSQG